MAYDVLIKGGRIYDGSGLPSYLGDVAVQDGRVRFQESRDREDVASWKPEELTAAQNE